MRILNEAIGLRRIVSTNRFKVLVATFSLAGFATAAALGASPASATHPSNVTVGGTKWLLYWNWSDNGIGLGGWHGPCVETFHANGKFIDCTRHSGTWSLTGNDLEFDYNYNPNKENSCDSEWSGTYDSSSDQFAGTMFSDLCSSNGTFYMTPAGAVTGILFAGSVTDPKVTITGSGFGTLPPSTGASCSASGLDYDSNALYLEDLTGGWYAGSPGACIGLNVTHYSNTKIVFTFGNWYDTPPFNYRLNSQDQAKIVVDGNSADAYVNY